MVFIFRLTSHEKLGRFLLLTRGQWVRFELIAYIRALVPYNTSETA